MANTRYEISICYTDKKGQKRYVNGVGNLWFDGTRGTIELPPGVALVGGQANVYINVQLPRERAQGGGQQRGGGRQESYESSGDDDGSSDIPF